MCDDFEPVDEDIDWLKKRKADCSEEDIFQFTNMLEIFLEKGFPLAGARNLALNDLVLQKRGRP